MWYSFMKPTDCGRGPFPRLWQAGGLPYLQHRSRPDHLIFSTLTLTRDSPSEVISHGWAEREARAMEVTVSLGETGVTMLGIHPLAPTNARRAALRDAQFEFVADWAGKARGPSVVVGDFNATPWSHVFGPLTGSGFRNSQRGFGWPRVSRWTAVSSPGSPSTIFSTPPIWPCPTGGWGRISDQTTFHLWSTWHWSPHSECPLAMSAGD